MLRFDAVSLRVLLLALGLSIQAHGEETLPTNKDGFHATSDHEHFTAFVRKNGVLAIFLKQDGKRIPGLEPILVMPECQVSGKTGWYRRDPISLTTKGEPTEKATKISFEGKTADGVTYVQHYTIGKDRIQAWGACEDPDGLTPPTEFRVRVQLVRTHLLEDDADPAKVTEHVKGSTFLAETTEGKIELPFDQRQSLTKNRPFRAVKRLQVASSDWHGLSLDITAPRTKYGQLQVWNYPEQALYRGFSASLHKEDSSEDSKSSAITLRIQPSR